jgi:hypothetical protein
LTRGKTVVHDPPICRRNGCIRGAGYVRLCWAADANAVRDSIVREFFRPWQRKIGMLTLLMACVLLGAWARGRKYGDGVLFRSSKYTRCEISSSPLGIGFCVYDETDALKRSKNNFDFQHSDWSNMPSQPFEGLGFDWRLNSNGFLIGSNPGSGTTIGIRIIAVPHFAFIIPLTAISAWLLLAMPRLTKPAKPTAEAK